MGGLDALGYLEDRRSLRYLRLGAGEEGLLHVRLRSDADDYANGRQACSNSAAACKAVENGHRDIQDTISGRKRLSCLKN